MPNLHRNNAAEWVMLIVLSPLSLLSRIARDLRKTRRHKKTVTSITKSASKKPISRPITIEGLPPRTMN